jgi:DNA-directed RNA polymerase subunit RPC12/RpoP
MAQKQYKCEVCGATLDSKTELEEHDRKLHPQYGCGICGETFSSERELEIHSRIAHPEQTPIR